MVNMGMCGVQGWVGGVEVVSGRDSFAECVEEEGGRAADSEPPQFLEVYLASSVVTWEPDLEVDSKARKVVMLSCSTLWFVGHNLEYFCEGNQHILWSTRKDKEVVHLFLRVGVNWEAEPKAQLMVENIRRQSFGEAWFQQRDLFHHS